MADALAAAVVRLRDRAEEAHAEPLGELEDEEEGGEPQSHFSEHAHEAGLAGTGAPAEESSQEGPGEHEGPAEELRHPVSSEPHTVLAGPRYKHSLSLIGRLRLARKQRRART
jgi:hypothetical protein